MQCEGALDGATELPVDVPQGQESYLAQYVAVFLCSYHIKAVTDEFLGALLGVKVATNPAYEPIPCSEHSRGESHKGPARSVSLDRVLEGVLQLTVFVVAV